MLAVKTGEKEAVLRVCRDRRIRILCPKLTETGLGVSPGRASAVHHSPGHKSKAAREGGIENGPVLAPQMLGWSVMWALKEFTKRRKCREQRFYFIFPREGND